MSPGHYNTDLTVESQVATKLLNDVLWHNPAIAKERDIIINDYGYELCFTDAEQQEIRATDTQENRQIRHRPDFYVEQPGQHVPTYLEYKVSRSPRYSEPPPLCWSVVPIHTQSWRECLRRTKSGDRVAILVFCPYHSRPLTCEMVSKIRLHRQKSYRISPGRGSGLPFVNVNLAEFRTLSKFLLDELNIPVDISRPLLEKFLEAARTRKELQVVHDTRDERGRELVGGEPTWIDW